MSFTWTEQDALNLTEDVQTRRDGSKLATRSKWPMLGMDEQAIWGHCQGSGKDPYRVSVDKSELAYRCSCPSKKFPCKHTMALLILFAKEQKLFTQGGAPGWVTEWLESRQKRADKEAERKEAAATAPVDTAAQAKRAQARANKVDDGLQELRLWLTDLVRQGFVNPQVKSYAYWDRMAARMVDAQAASIGRRLRQIASIPIQGQPDWSTRLLDEVSRLYLLADSYQRIDNLPDALQEDLRTAIGWSYKREELLSLPAVRDLWLVLGQVTEGDDALRARRVWLRGERSGQNALILDFAAGRGTFDELYMNGQRYEAELVYYPSAYPQRAFVKEIIQINSPAPGSMPGQKMAGYANATAMLADYATALGSNPWLERVPFVLHQATLATIAEQWVILDAEARIIPIKGSGKGTTLFWNFLAQSGGHPATVIGEWDGYEAVVLDMASDEVPVLDAMVT